MGADVVYIVDSAGGMMSYDIRNYNEVIRDVSSVKVGFHGHNSIGMALANSLDAINMEINIIDCSLYFRNDGKK